MSDSPSPPSVASAPVPPPAVPQEPQAAPISAAPAARPARQPVGLTKAVTTQAIKPNRPAGWFSVKASKGLKSDIAATIAAHPEMPDHWKTLLAAELDGPDFASAQAVKIDAHRFASKGKVIVQLTITPIF